MSVPFSLHAEFEEAVYAAFPRNPVPKLENWTPQSWLERNAKSLFANKPWPEIIGLRMMRNELDDSFISWIKFMPGEVVAYYLPCHLILGSVLLWYGTGQNYVDNLMEAFILLPPGLDPDTAEDIDMELGLSAGVVAYEPWRVGFYERLTTAQRAVVGQFLDLYRRRAQQTSQYSERGLQLLAQNRDYWLNASWRSVDDRPANTPDNTLE